MRTSVPVRVTFPRRIRAPDQAEHLGACLECLDGDQRRRVIGSEEMQAKLLATDDWPRKYSHLRRRHFDARRVAVVDRRDQVFANACGTYGPGEPCRAGREGRNQHDTGDQEEPSHCCALSCPA
jgi:hypothetical protein